ncbi:MAG TPA: hypothetical protein VEC16_01220 [Alphaproteobacteria bacterium]|nr:hypothetical protein [Alphaproteobacteria bacterium]
MNNLESMIRPRGIWKPIVIVGSGLAILIAQTLYNSRNTDEINVKAKESSDYKIKYNDALADSIQDKYNRKKD